MMNFGLNKLRYHLFLFQSLIEQHAVLTFYQDRLAAEKRGITGNLLRYSVGFEHPHDVINDFEQAFRLI